MRCLFVALLAFWTVISTTNFAAAQAPDPCKRPGSDLIFTDCVGRLPARGSSASVNPLPKFERVSADFIKGPKPTGPQPAEAVFYDLAVEKLCGKGSINEAAEQFIKDAPKGWWKEKRAIALTATISFAEAADAKTATIPLIALAANGDGTKPQAINCNPVIMAGIPADQVLTVQLDLNWASGQFVIGDDPKILVQSVGEALGAAALLGPHTATAGAGILAFASGLGALTTATNKFLAVFAKKDGEIPHIERWENTTSRLVFGNLKSPTFALQKNYKLTNIRIAAPNPDRLPAAFITLFGAANGLSVVANAAAVEYAVAKLQKTPEHLQALCSKVVGESQRLYGADAGAVALSIFYYMSTQDIFSDTRTTCLTRHQIGMVNTIGFSKEPYTGAFDPDAADKLAKQKQEPKPDSPAGAVSDAVFASTEVLMTNFARQLKNLPARLSSTASGEKQRAIDDLSSLFDESVVVAGEGIGLLPRVDRGLPRDEVVTNILKWGPVSRFGCYGKPKSTNAIAREVTGETLILFPDRSLLAHAQFGKVDGALKILSLELSKAGSDVVERLIDRQSLCGIGDERWDPREDLKRLNAVSLNQ